MRKPPRVWKLWRILQPNRDAISCQVRADDQGHFNVVLIMNGMRVSDRRCLSYSAAELEADAMKDRMLASVRGVLVTERPTRH
jgi:hypothetical protein